MEPSRELSIDRLILTDEDREQARRQVRKLAYFKWVEAGRPEDNSLEFWKAAEREWIEYFYVPRR